MQKIKIICIYLYSIQDKNIPDGGRKRVQFIHLSPLALPVLNAQHVFALPVTPSVSAMAHDNKKRSWQIINKLASNATKFSRDAQSVVYILILNRA